MRDGTTTNAKDQVPAPCPSAQRAVTWREAGAKRPLLTSFPTAPDARWRDSEATVQEAQVTGVHDRNPLETLTDEHFSFVLRISLSRGREAERPRGRFLLTDVDAKREYRFSSLHDVCAHLDASITGGARSAQRTRGDFHD
jgi:hypothetical protein